MHERLKVGSDEIALHARSAYLLAAEVTIPAGGGPPAMHRHPSEELYRIEAGELAIYRRRRADRRRPRLGRPHPRRPAHNVRNETDAAARAYVVFSPGTEIERFFRAVAEDPADVMALAEAHGIEFTA